MSTCPRCDEYGPDLPTLDAGMKNLHRELHNLWHLLARPLERLLTRRTTRRESRILNHAQGQPSMGHLFTKGHTMSNHELLLAEFASLAADLRKATDSQFSRSLMSVRLKYIEGLLPTRTEDQIKADALHDLAAHMETLPAGTRTTHDPATIRAHADRLDPRKDGCEIHKPVQHRDNKPPWCKQCGLTAGGETPLSRADRLDPYTEN